MDKPLYGRTIAITGASNGIGLSAAVTLTGMGARTILVCRDRGRGEAAVAAARKTGGSSELVAADLSSQAEVRRAASEVLSLAPRLHVLVNNAGAINPKRELTVDGLERTFATNHLAYFLLTSLLLDRLKASAPARIVNVASVAHGRAPAGIPFDDLNAERGYSAWRAYGESKLANILFTRELARRLEGTGAVANSMHPGVVATGFGANSGGLLRLAMRLARPFLLTPEQGADTIVYLASSPEAASVTGRYFVKRREVEPRPAALDDGAAKRLWEVSEKLTDL